MVITQRKAMVEKDVWTFGRRRWYCYRQMSLKRLLVQYMLQLQYFESDSTKKNFIKISSFCNARLINPLNSLGAAVWQLQCTHRLLYLRQTSRLCTRNERPETMDQKYERIPIFRCRRKLECLEKTYQGEYGIGKPNSHTTTGLLHWWKESVWALNQPASPLE